MAITNHAVDQMCARYPDLKVKIESTLVIAEARFTRGAVAVRLAELPEVRGPQVANWAQAGASSNGDTIWGIIRNGRVVTVFTRRSKPSGRAPQPSTKTAFRVDAVVWSV